MRKAARPKIVRPNRMLHFHGGRIWLYKIGKTYIITWSPEGRRHTWRVSEIVGISPDNIDKMRWDKDFHVVPSDIKDYIYRMGLEPTPLWYTGPSWLDDRNRGPSSGANLL